MSILEIIQQGSGLEIQTGALIGPQGEQGIQGPIGPVGPVDPDIEQRTTTQRVIKTLADISEYLVSGVYELPANRYVFDNDIDFGTARIKFITTNGFYEFLAKNFQVVTYSGTDPFVFNDVGTTGIIIQSEYMFYTTPNATCFELVNGNSFIFQLTVFLNCAIPFNIDNFTFCTLTDFPIVSCADGVYLNNVTTFTGQLLQFNVTPGTGVSGFNLSGASSQRFIGATIDARPDTGDSMFNISNDWGGKGSINGGSLESGILFASASRKQDDPKIVVSGIIGARNSQWEMEAVTTSNTTTTISVQDEWVDLKDDTTDFFVLQALSERFIKISNSEYEYIGLEQQVFDTEVHAIVEKSGGGSDLICVGLSFLIAPSVVFVDSEDSKGCTQNSTPTQVIAKKKILLNTGDRLKAICKNVTGTSNILSTQPIKVFASKS